jgi:hypothetical protein
MLVPKNNVGQLLRNMLYSRSMWGWVVHLNMLIQLSHRSKSKDYTPYVADTQTFVVASLSLNYMISLCAEQQKIDHISNKSRNNRV